MTPEERQTPEARIPILRERLDAYEVWLREQEKKEKALHKALEAHHAYMRKGTAKADALSVELSRIYLKLKNDFLYSP